MCKKESPICVSGFYLHFLHIESSSLLFLSWVKQERTDSTEGTAQVFDRAQKYLNVSREVSKSSFTFLYFILWIVPLNKKGVCRF